MSKSGANIAAFRQGLKDLADWFERQKRVLPWRDEPSLYRVWISEIMLQQTQVVTVIPYFERFLKAFPSVEALAAAPEEDVLRAWAGLGYYSRARNLHRAAQRIVAAGRFPGDRAGWLEIPGVGEYTAGAILSIALDQPEAILDGNVERVLSRVWAADRAGGDAAYKQRLWKLSRGWVRASHESGIRPSVTNQALMELGATLCSPRKPKCLLCPLASICRARKQDAQENYPPRKKPKEWIEVREEVHCVFDGRGRMLLHRRAKGQWRAGLWDFSETLPSPGLERLGAIERKLVVTRHKITRIAHVWRVRKESEVLRASEGFHDSRWVLVAEPGLAVGASLKKTLQSIRESYPEVIGK
ncbi:MAG: A/G-specific adenine glycosylase [Oligoflexia bacterium]|nr:A/G-specific adenine glycosylase [Oligoflexia bacterium]